MRINKRNGWLCVLTLVFLLSCVSHEGDPRLSDKPLSEIFKDREKLPAIEDPDPEIEEPDYEQLLGGGYSFRMLEEISGQSKFSSGAKEMLEAINDQIRNVDPQVKEKFKDVTLEFLVEIMDPRVPLDSQLEEILQKLQENVGSGFPDIDMFEIDDLEELKAAQKAGSGLGVNPFDMSVTPNFGTECALGVYDEFRLGPRSCGLELEQSLGLIEANYLRRLVEAQERFEKRNSHIRGFSLEKLPLIVGQFRDVLNIIKQNSTKEEVEGIKSNLGYLAAAYAYHLRLNVPLWMEYGFKLNEWYYYKELHLYTQIRFEKEIEALEALNACIDWVNDMIIVEVSRRCPGDEPILY